MISQQSAFPSFDSALATSKSAFVCLVLMIADGNDGPSRDLLHLDPDSDRLVWKMARFVLLGGHDSVKFSTRLVHVLLQLVRDGFVAVEIGNEWRLIDAAVQVVTPWSSICMVFVVVVEQRIGQNGTKLYIIRGRANTASII
jgi:hypothetical protein